MCTCWRRCASLAARLPGGAHRHHLRAASPGGRHGTGARPHLRSRTRSWRAWAMRAPRSWSCSASTRRSGRRPRRSSWSAWAVVATWRGWSCPPNRRSAVTGRAPSTRSGAWRRGMAGGWSRWTPWRSTAPGCRAAASGSWSRQVTSTAPLRLLGRRYASAAVSRCRPWLPCRCSRCRLRDAAGGRVRGHGLERTVGGMTGRGPARIDALGGVAMSGTDGTGTGARPGEFWTCRSGRGSAIDRHHRRTAAVFGRCPARDRSRGYVLTIGRRNVGLVLRAGDRSQRPRSLR